MVLKVRSSHDIRMGFGACGAAWRHWRIYLDVIWGEGNAAVWSRAIEYEYAVVGGVKFFGR